MTKRTHRLRNSALTCLLVAWPLFTAAQPQGESEPARLSVSHTAPLAPDDPLRLWFKEQDRLLDDILLRLSRIENLVSALQRLIQQLPAASPPGVQSTPVAPAQPQATPVAPVLPLVTVAPAPKPARHTTGVLAFFDAWGTLLAGGCLLLLVLMMASRHHRSRQSSSAQPQAKAGTQPVTTAKPGQTPEKTPSSAPHERQRKETEAQGSTHDQAMHLAEIMLSMGLGHGAAQMLVEQIRNEPKQALRHWLKLLEIYHQNGQQAEFEQSAEELRLHFNVRPEDWSALPAARHSVEDYPHIAARLTELWGKPSSLTYLQNLLADNRDGVRSGFPQAVAEELLLLTAILKTSGIALAAGTTIE